MRVFREPSPPSISTSGTQPDPTQASFTGSRSIHFVVDKLGLGVAMAPCPDPEDWETSKKEVEQSFYNARGLTRAEIMTARNKPSILTGATFIEHDGLNARSDALTAANAEASANGGAEQPSLWTWRQPVPPISQPPSSNTQARKRQVAWKDQETVDPEATCEGTEPTVTSGNDTRKGALGNVAGGYTSSAQSRA